MFGSGTSLLELPAPADLDGLDVRGTWDPEREALGTRSLFFESDVVLPDDGPGSYLALGSNRAVRRGRFKYHLDVNIGVARLFDLSRDPGERVDVLAEHPEVARDLARDMQRFLAYRVDETPIEDLTGDEKARLRAMGYLQDD